MDRSPDRRLAELAASQWGVVTHDDALAVGLTERMLRDRVGSAVLTPVHRGVFRVTGAPSPWEQAAYAAVRFNGLGAALSCRAAGRLWGFAGLSRSEVEVSKPRGRSQRKAYGRVHGSTLLPAAHLTERTGIPITTPARTVFDLAGKLWPDHAERVLDNALSSHACTITQLDAVFDTLARRGRKGTVLMRQLLEARGDGYVAPSSELEALGRRVIADAGLPEPLVEMNLGSESEWFGRVDLVYRDARLIIELDSRRHHTAFLDRQADRTRDNRFMAEGWRVIRYTWWDLIERPHEVVAEIRRALSASIAA